MFVFETKKSNHLVIPLTIFMKNKGESIPTKSSSDPMFTRFSNSKLCWPQVAFDIHILQE